MNSPITYIPNFVSAPDAMLAVLDRDLDWVRHDKVPRSEYYVNWLGDIPYTYGQGAGVRTYQAQRIDPIIQNLKNKLENFSNTKFDVCFLNKYDDQRDHLGWHADDSPEMDDDRPIAIVSLGAERKIWFRKNSTVEVEEVLLQNGSLCLMHAGMQDTHQHRIPKSDRIVGKRISFTFRGFKK